MLRTQEYKKAGALKRQVQNDMCTLRPDEQHGVLIEMKIKQNSSKVVTFTFGQAKARTDWRDWNIDFTEIFFQYNLFRTNLDDIFFYLFFCYPFYDFRIETTAHLAKTIFFGTCEILKRDFIIISFFGWAASFSLLFCSVPFIGMSLFQQNIWFLS